MQGNTNQILGSKRNSNISAYSAIGRCSGDECFSQTGYHGTKQDSSTQCSIRINVKVLKRFRRSVLYEPDLLPTSCFQVYHNQQEIRGPLLSHKTEP